MKDYKLNPEIKFSKGIRNLWNGGRTAIGEAMTSLTSNTVTISLNFYEGKLKTKQSASNKR